LNIGWAETGDTPQQGYPADISNRSQHLDKAPDAFRTISEVADDLDIPQHVLRFWETRFSQIKPMKRSGGRRYYRPDDVDLLRGIRRLLYGEGYTIRGVQRILKEHGIKSVQGLIDGSPSTPSFAATDEAARHEQPEHDEDAADIDAADNEDDIEDEVVEGSVAARRAPEIAPVARRPDPAGLPQVSPVAVPRAESVAIAPKLDTTRLKAALDDLIACRQLLDLAVKEG
jgi:DNA-binding transcriptional MerR regulator